MILNEHSPFRIAGCQKGICMATYDLDRTEFNHLLTPNIDPGARAAVIDYLLANGGFDDDHGPHSRHGDSDFSGGHNGSAPTVKGKISDGTPPLATTAPVLDAPSTSKSVTTDAALKVIVE